MGPLTPDVSELILGLVCFALVFLALGRILLPRIAKTIADRHDAIEGGLDRADATRAESERALREYREEMTAIRHETALLRQDALEKGAEDIAAARAEGHRIREEIVASGHARMNAERADAETVLRAELGLIATELAGKIIGESLHDFVVDRDIVERFLAERNVVTTTTA